MSTTVELVGQGLLARLDAVAAAAAALPPPEFPHGDPVAMALVGFERLREIARRPVRIALMGESNAGKTTLANRLIGTDILPTSVVSNTSYDVWVRHAFAPSVHATGADGRRMDCSRDAAARPDEIRGLEIGLPFSVLRDIEIIDTSALRLAKGTDTKPSPLPKADVLVWCTNAARAWGASERAARNACPPIPPARAILAATHADTLRGPAAREAVHARLRREAGQWFGTVVFTGREAEGGVDADETVAGDAAADGAPSLPFDTLVLRTANQFRTRRERTLSRLAGRLARLSRTAIAASPSHREAAGLCAALDALLPPPLTFAVEPLRRQRLSPMTGVNEAS